jgi:hypothetical protein
MHAQRAAYYKHNPQDHSVIDNAPNYFLTYSLPPPHYVRVVQGFGEYPLHPTKTSQYHFVFFYSFYVNLRSFAGTCERCLPVNERDSGVLSWAAFDVGAFASFDRFISLLIRLINHIRCHMGNRYPS